MGIAEEIYELVQQLPYSRQIEVLDFASYVAQREEKLLSDDKPSFQLFAGVLKVSAAKPTYYQSFPCIVNFPSPDPRRRVS